LHIALPLYSDQIAAYWPRIANAVPTVGMLIFNPDSGPGAARDARVASQVRAMQHGHVGMLGYVATGYDNDPESADAIPLARAEAEVAAYYAWYHPSGIFIDEANAGNCAIEQSYYLPLYRFIKQRDSHAIVALNPGTVPQKCYMAAAGVIVTFEDRFSAYTSSYTVPPWARTYPASRFWHIVQDVPDDASMRQVVTRARQRNVGWIYVTGDDSYFTLPTYWNGEIAAVNASNHASGSAALR
jgi:hypothetical protein